MPPIHGPRAHTGAPPTVTATTDQAAAAALAAPAANTGRAKPASLNELRQFRQRLFAAENPAAKILADALATAHREVQYGGISTEEHRERCEAILAAADDLVESNIDLGQHAILAGLIPASGRPAQYRLSEMEYLLICDDLGVQRSFASDLDADARANLQSPLMRAVGPPPRSPAALTQWRLAVWERLVGHTVAPLPPSSTDAARRALDGGMPVHEVIRDFGLSHPADVLPLCDHAMDGADPTEQLPSQAWLAASRELNHGVPVEEVIDRYGIRHPADLRAVYESTAPRARAVDAMARVPAHQLAQVCAMIARGASPALLIDLHRLRHPDDIAAAHAAADVHP